MEVILISGGQQFTGVFRSDGLLQDLVAPVKWPYHPLEQRLGRAEAETLQEDQRQKKVSEAGDASSGIRQVNEEARRRVRADVRRKARNISPDAIMATFQGSLEVVQRAAFEAFQRLGISQFWVHGPFDGKYVYISFSKSPETSFPHAGTRVTKVYPASEMWVQAQDGGDVQVGCKGPQCSDVLAGMRGVLGEH